MSRNTDPPADAVSTAGSASLAPLSAATRGFVRALASDTRQDILMLFADGSELTVGQVEERTGLAPSTTSEQLAILRRGGLLTSRRDGKQVLYMANRAGIVRAFEELTTFLNRCC
jgi:DNA-binding transcriptional ArsR family regulator